MTDWAVIVPSNRQDKLSDWIVAWRDSFRKAAREPLLVVVWDGDEIIRRAWPFELIWADWLTIPEWIPRRTDMVRSWGIWLAAQAGAEYCVTLDDDVRPWPGVDLLGEYERVFEAGAVVSDYLDVGALTTSGRQMRGFPHGQRERRPVAIQYGGWDGVMDYDARTQLDGAPMDCGFSDVVLPVPRGVAVTGCAMNMAWQTRYAPLTWQLPVLEGVGYRRYGDIWAGLIAKRTCDAADLAVVVNGRASVKHQRASDPEKNLEIELAGEEPNERLWQHLGRLPSGLSVDAIYAEYLTRFAHLFDPEYTDVVINAATSWLALDWPRGSP